MSDALAARIGASLSRADKVAGEFSEVMYGDSTFTVEPVCIVKGVWRTESDEVDFDCTLVPFEVDGGGGGVRLRDDCVAGVSKGGFFGGTGKRFDSELLVIRAGFEGG